MRQPDSALQSAGAKPPPLTGVSQGCGNARLDRECVCTKNSWDSLRYRQNTINIDLMQNIMSSYFFCPLSLFWKKNRSKLRRSPCCLWAWTNIYETWYACHGNLAHLNGILINPSRQSVCVCECFWMPEPIFMKLGMYRMTPESISTVYSINPSHQSVCLYISLSLLGNGWVNTLRRQWIHMQQ
jgi:hypothetical protein